MQRKEKIARHDERKAMNIVGEILGRGFGRDSEHGFLRLSKSDLSKVHSDSRAKKAGELFAKAGDMYLDAGKYQEANISYMSAIETYSGGEPEQDTPKEDRFRKDCSSKIEAAKKLQHKKESNLQERLGYGHFLAHTSNAMHYHPSFLISIIGLIGGIFFLSSNITGNAIADLSTKTSSLIGAVLLIVGLVAGFFWFKSRKK